LELQLENTLTMFLNETVFFVVLMAGQNRIKRPKLMNNTLLKQKHTSLKKHLFKVGKDIIKFIKGENSWSVPFSKESDLGLGMCIF